MNSLASSKCATRVLAVLAAFTALIFTAACGSGSGLGTPNQEGFSKSNFSGNYVIAVSGTDVNTETESYFAIAGTIVADGNGNITGGTVDINDANITSGNGVYLAQSLTASTYAVTQDGRGTATLKTPVGNFGIDFVLTSNSHGLITRFDDDGTGSGTIDLQGSASQSSLASLTFSLSGVDYNASSSSLAPLATVGSVTLNTSTGAVSSGIADLNDNGSSSVSGLAGLSITGGSVVLGSSASGTATFTSAFGTLSFDVWPIDSTHLKFIETDTATTGYAIAGDAFTQQTSFPAGQLVFTVGGLDSTLSSLVVAGGFVTATTNGVLTNGTEDYNDGGSANTITNFGGACTASAPFPSGRCELALNGFSNGSLNNYIFAAYPSSGGIQLLEIDDLGILQGAAYAQTATSLGAAGYGLNLSGGNSDGPVDDIAQFNATTATTDNIPQGVLDENDFGSLAPDVAFNGTYTPDGNSDGRGSITIPNSGSIGTLIGELTLQYYVVDASTVLLIEVDGEQGTLGTFELQSTPSSQVASQSHMALVHTVVKSHGARAVRRPNKTAAK